jgi:hypothetical protein
MGYSHADPLGIVAHGARHRGGSGEWDPGSRMVWPGGAVYQENQSCRSCRRCSVLSRLQRQGSKWGSPDGGITNYVRCVEGMPNASVCGS